MAYQPKSYRKFIAGAAAAAVIAPAVAPAASLAAVNFPDVEGQYVPAVEFLASKGIQGKLDGTFGTHENITRQDAAVFLTKALGLDTKNAPDAGFTDVAPRAAGAANALKAAGITQGKSATTFGGGDLITRGELAKWLVAAYGLEAGKTQNDFTDVEGHYIDAVNALVNSEVTSGKTATTFGTHENATRGQFAVFVYKAANVDTEVAPVVESANAINAKELKVVFNTEVDENSAETAANYVLKVNKVQASGLAYDLQADGKTVLISKADGTDLFENGNYYTVEVKDVLTKGFDKVAKYETETQYYFDTVAPTVVTSELTASDKVRVYFDEPVSGVKLKVNGSALSQALTTTNEDGKYYVEVPALSDDKKVGTHTVTVYDAVDGDGNKLTVATTQYTVADDTAAPSVVSVTPDSANKFKVKVSEKLASTPTFEVKKGGIKFATTAVLDSEDPTDLTYEVTVGAADGSYKLYNNNEKTVNLSLTIKNIKDASNLVGADYKGTVTLTNDEVGPKVLSANTNTVDVNGLIKVKFDEEISSSVDASKVKVYKDNVLLATSASATGTDEFLSIQLPQGEEGKVATYTIKLEAGAVKDASDNKNNALTTTASYKVDSNVNATITPDGANKYKVVFASVTDMTDSATDVANYSLDGEDLPAGTTIDFIGNKKTVVITLPSESIAKTTQASLQIAKTVVNKAGQQVADADNKAITALVNITDNVKPLLVSGKFVDANKDKLAESVELTFSEDMDATVTDLKDFEFVVNGSKVTPSGISYTDDKATVTFTAGEELNTNQALTIKVVPANDQNPKVMDAKDVQGNQLTASTTITVNTVK